MRPATVRKGLAKAGCDADWQPGSQHTGGHMACLVPGQAKSRVSGPCRTS